MPRCAILSCQKEHTNGFLCSPCFDDYCRSDGYTGVCQYTAEKNKTNKTKEPLPVAIKQDKGKPRHSLIRPEFLDGLAQCLTFGAAKYDDHNYAKGFDWSRLYDALQRHLTAWLAGEDLDLESGLSHLDHAASCLMMLRYHTANNVGKDDRLKKVA